MSRSSFSIHSWQPNANLTPTMHNASTSKPISKEPDPKVALNEVKVHQPNADKQKKSFSLHETDEFEDFS